MSTSSNGEVSAQDEDQDPNPNKRTSEKIRRDQENLYLEELSHLVSVNLPDFSDSDDSASKEARIEKGSILKETVNRLRKIKNERSGHKNTQENEAKTSLLPKEVLGSLVLEALDGFMFIVNSSGKVEFISDNAQDYLGIPDSELLGESIYKFVHLGDHARLFVTLQSWQDDLLKSDEKAEAALVDDETSKILNIRFEIGKIKAEEPDSKENKLYEDLQVSAMHMLTENQEAENSSAVMCIARRIPPNEASMDSPVESFTTQIELDNWTVTAVDTSGLPKQYVQVIGPLFIGKQLTQIVHPQDVSLLNLHLSRLEEDGSDLSSVYRLVFPAPLYTVHVKTKSKIFKPDSASLLKGFVMSTHHLVRDCELSVSELPALTADKGIPSPTSSSLPVDPSTYGKIKLVLGEDVIMSSTKLEDSSESVRGIDVDSLIRGDPEVFMPMMLTAAKAFDISAEKLKTLIPLSLPGSLTSNTQSLMNREEEGGRKLSGYEKLTMSGLQVLTASQVGKTNHVHSLTTIRSRHSSGRMDPSSYIPNSLTPRSLSTGNSKQPPSASGQLPVASRKPEESGKRQPGSPRQLPQSHPTSPHTALNNDKLSPPSPRNVLYHTSPRGGGSLTPSPNPPSPVTTTKADRLTGLLSNTLNFRSSSAGVQRVKPVAQHQYPALGLAQLADTNQKPNQLLKELLTAKENLSSRPSTTDNISLRQLLNNKPEKNRSESELLRRLNEPAKDPRSRLKTSELTKLLEARGLPGAKRPATSPDQGPLAKQSAMMSGGVASLESLLRKDAATPATTTGVSAKWSEIPNKNLLRSQVINRFQQKSAGNTSILHDGDKVVPKTGEGVGGGGVGIVVTIPSVAPSSTTSIDTSSSQEFPSELFDLDLSELDSMMSPELLSAMDTMSTTSTNIMDTMSTTSTSIMSEDQAQISAIEQQLMQVEKNIKISHQQQQQLHLASSPSPGGGHHHLVAASPSPGGGHHHLVAASPSPGVADSPRPASFSSPSPSHPHQNVPSSSSTGAVGGLATGLQQAMSSPTGGLVVPGLAQAMSPPSGRIITAGQGGEASSQMQQYHNLDNMKVNYETVKRNENRNNSGPGPGHSGPKQGHSGPGPGHSGPGPGHSGLGPGHSGPGPGQSIEDLMKHVPPNVTMKPGFDGPGSSKDVTMPLRHLSGDTIIGAPARTTGRGVPGSSGPGIRNTSRHASGDSLYMSEASNNVGNSMRRYSGDSILFRRLDGGSLSPRLGSRSSSSAGNRQVAGGSRQQAAGLSPGHTSSSSRPGSGFIPALSPDLHIPATIGSTNVGTLHVQRTMDSTNKILEGPSGRSLSQEDLETLGLSIEVTKNDFFSTMGATRQPMTTSSLTQHTHNQRIGTGSGLGPSSPATAMSTLGLSSPNVTGSVQPSRHVLTNITGGSQPQIPNYQHQQIRSGNLQQQPQIRTTVPHGGQVMTVAGQQQQVVSNRQPTPATINNPQELMHFRGGVGNTPLGSSRMPASGATSIQHQQQMQMNNPVGQQQIRLTLPQSAIRAAISPNVNAGHSQQQLIGQQQRLTSSPLLSPQQQQLPMPRIRSPIPPHQNQLVRLSSPPNPSTMPTVGLLSPGLSVGQQQVRPVQSNSGYLPSNQQQFIQPSSTVSSQQHQFAPNIQRSSNAPNIVQLGGSPSGSVVYCSSGNVSGAQVQGHQSIVTRMPVSQLQQPVQNRFISSAGSTTTVNVNPSQVFTSGNLLPTQAGNTLQLGSTSIQLASKPMNNPAPSGTNSSRQLGQSEIISTCIGGGVSLQLPSGMVTISSQNPSGVTLHQSRPVLNQSRHSVDQSSGSPSMIMAGGSPKQQIFSSVSIHPGGQQTHQSSPYGGQAVQGRVVVMSSQADTSPGGSRFQPTMQQARMSSPLHSSSSLNTAYTCQSQPTLSSSHVLISTTSPGVRMPTNTNSASAVSGFSTVNRTHSVLQRALSNPPSILQNALSSRQISQHQMPTNSIGNERIIGLNQTVVQQVSSNNSHHQMVSTIQQRNDRINSNIVMGNQTAIISSANHTQSVPLNQILANRSSHHQVSSNQGVALNVMMTNQMTGNSVSNNQVTGNSVMTNHMAGSLLLTNEGAGSVSEAQLLSPSESRILESEIWPNFKTSVQDCVQLDLEELLKDA